MINSISSETKIQIDSPEVLGKVLEGEKRERSETEVIAKEKDLIIKIKSKDLVAFKATINQQIKIIETAINALRVR